MVNYSRSNGNSLGNKNGYTNNTQIVGIPVMISTNTYPATQGQATIKF